MSQNSRDMRKKNTTTSSNNEFELLRNEMKELKIQIKQLKLQLIGKDQENQKQQHAPLYATSKYTGVDTNNCEEVD
ncbi:3801_t:CDS:2 [Ambispora gerdemannii]|uniref:3801_t:CDS:1 n=1 Tax=Ambispora gerdemannii TaxID=144530 RepID=A0A9N8ZFT7_9GLOM|nr:3801_t:CDS:2 [Ambispora gerdemannii]